jgi:hypothetical protein
MAHFGASWVNQDEIDSGEREGLTTEEKEELRRLGREVKPLPQERNLAKSGGGSTARCNTVGFEYCPGRRCGSGEAGSSRRIVQGRQELWERWRAGESASDIARHYRSLPALFTGCSKPPARSLRLSGAGEDVHSPRLSERRSPSANCGCSISTTVVIHASNTPLNL